MKEIKEGRKDRRTQERQVIIITRRMKKKNFFINCNRYLKSPPPPTKRQYIDQSYTRVKVACNTNIYELLHSGNSQQTKKRNKQKLNEKTKEK